MVPASSSLNRKSIAKAASSLFRFILAVSARLSSLQCVWPMRP
jgi:hypothetical protein